MYYYVIIIVILVITAGIGLNAKVKNTDKVKSVANPIVSQKPHQPIKFLSKNDIIKKLETLKKTPPPVKLKMGAMCYEMASPPLRTEYVCPVCGEKTLYAFDNDIELSSEHYKIISVLHDDLTELRRGIKLLKSLNLNITYSENEFCKKCYPEMKNPTLKITIQYPDDNSKTIIENVSANDIKLLNDFFKGSAIHKTFNDEEEPLTKYMERLEILLGVKNKKEVEKNE